MSDHQIDRERAALRRPRTSADTPQTDTPPAHPLIALQRQVGNAQIARMLAQRESVPEEEEELMQASRDPSLQRESVPEEEEELMQASRDPSLQREGAPEEEEELMQMSRGPEVGPEGGPVSDATAGQIESMRGGGSGLDDATRNEMEGSLGADFSDVRIHTGGESQQLNRSLGAQAFTTGSDIFFGPNGSPGDKGLLAHELTHVVQQRGMSGGGPLTVGAADDSYEQQAESTAAAVQSGVAQPKRDDDNA